MELLHTTTKRALPVIIKLVQQRMSEEETTLKSES
jgi:hypothetical protein